MAGIGYRLTANYRVKVRSGWSSSSYVRCGQDRCVQLNCLSSRRHIDRRARTPRPSRDAAQGGWFGERSGWSGNPAANGDILARSARAHVMRRAARSKLAAARSPRRLCLGSGLAPIDGWINIDFEPPADVLLDVRFGIPVPSGSIDAIYSEHLIEHVPLETAIRMFSEWRRVLSPRGVVRIATPDLEEIVRDYRTNWRLRHEWVNWPEFAGVDTPVRMINAAMHDWGHRYLYDYKELRGRLEDAGFSNVRRVLLGESDDHALRNLETRRDSGLVVEARLAESSH